MLMAFDRALILGAILAITFAIGAQQSRWAADSPFLGR